VACTGASNKPAVAKSMLSTLRTWTMMKVAVRLMSAAGEKLTSPSISSSPSGGGEASITRLHPNGTDTLAPATGPLVLAWGVPSQVTGSDQKRVPARRSAAPPPSSWQPDSGQGRGTSSRDESRSPATKSCGRGACRTRLGGLECGVIVHAWHLRNERRSVALKLLMGPAECAKQRGAHLCRRGVASGVDPPPADRPERPVVVRGAVPRRAEVRDGVDGGAQQRGRAVDVDVVVDLRRGGAGWGGARWRRMRMGW
jgi:hypothetical protein